MDEREAKAEYLRMACCGDYNYPISEDERLSRCHDTPVRLVFLSCFASLIGRRSDVIKI